jgi:Zn-dependent peptidase ImmA (M78 family)
MATHYQVQLATLLMPAPLPTSTRPAIHDFRTAGGRDAIYTTDLALAVETAAGQLNSFGDLREVYPETLAAPKIPHYTRRVKAHAVARLERERLRVPVEQQYAWQTDSRAFNAWRNIIEAQGIFVLTLPMGEPDDVRGLSLWDQRGLGVIVLNNAEENNRVRCFTLLHEYCHILLRLCGISDQNRTSRIERFCNQFAAYFLMPPDAFAREAKALKREGVSWSDYHLNRLATRFNVSKTAVSYHLEDLGLARKDEFVATRPLWRLARRKRTGGGGPYTERCVNKLGMRTVDVVLGALDRGIYSKLDAYEVLEVRPAFFDGLRNEVMERKRKYGGYS